MNNLFHLIAKLPQFPGKLSLANMLYQSENNKCSRAIYGGAKMELDLNDRIQRRIYVKGCHEPETEYHLEKLAKNAKCFVDIGANVGYFSLMLSALYPKLEVHAFEPMPRNVEVLKNNKSINDYQLHIHPICLTDHSGEVEFAIPPLGECGWGRIASGNLANDFPHKMQVMAETLDQLHGRSEFSNTPDLIKIDVEGNELKVLHGAKNLLTQSKPVLCIEINEDCLRDNGISGQEIFDYLFDLNFKAHIIAEQKLVRVEKPDSTYKLLNYFFSKDDL